LTEEQKLIEDARRSREETEKLREETLPDEPSPGEPWAKTSSGDADHVTDDS